MIGTVVELSNIEIHEHCMLNRITGEREYNNEKKQMPYFTGLYFEEENVFFALYPTENGPIMYYEGKEYPIKAGENFSFAKGGMHSVKATKQFKMALLLTLD